MLRALAAEELPRLLPAALGALREWTATQTAAATRVLRAVLLLAEATVLPQLPAVLAALRAAAGGGSSDARAHGAAAAALLGANVAPRQWMPLAAEAAGAQQAALPARAAALAVLSQLLRGAAAAAAAAGAATGPAAAAAAAPDEASVQLAAAALAGGSLVSSAAQVPALKGALLEAMYRLVLWGGIGRAIAPVAAELLLPALLLLWSHEQQQQLQQPGGGGSISQGLGTATPVATAGDVMAALAAGCGLASTADLCARHSGRLIAASLAVSSLFINGSLSRGRGQLL